MSERPEATATPGVPPGADDPGPDASFEELMDALEGLTDRLAGGDLGIEQAAEIYERAETIHRRARARLEEVAERIARLGAAGAPPP